MPFHVTSNTLKTVRRTLGTFAGLLGIAVSVSAADFTVINTANGGPGSLSQAISDANALAGRDRVVFNIPGAGVHVIDVSANSLPQITDPLIVDGYTQPGARPNTLAVGNDALILIQIDNAQHNLPTGLHVSAGTSIIRGVSITGFASYGIDLTGPGAANIIEGNFIGLSPDGHTVAGNSIGIDVATPGNMIGGTTPEARNVISGNSLRYGIWVQRQPNTVSGNYIGTDASGMAALASRVGIHVDGSLSGGVVIGGTGSGAGNLISGYSIGIQLGYLTSVFGNIVYSRASGVEVTGNLIGVASDGKAPLGNNTGIYIVGSSNTSVGGLVPGAGNVIAFNGGAGVSVSGFGTAASNNKILSNSIFGRGLGIALGGSGPNSNDPMDGDDGENHRQNFPIITSTSVSGDNISIQGILNSTPNTQFTIQLFADGNDFLQPSQTLLGSMTATTDNDGNASFSAMVPLPNGNVTINATATDPAGNTSEFFLRPSHFRNLSTRARIQPGEAALIGGFIAQGFSNAGSEIIVRVVGPSLASGGVPISDSLQDPILEIYVNGRLIGSNDNWRDDPTGAAEVEKYGLAPANDMESAAVIYPGNDGQYTAVIRGKNNSSGIGLVEFYDVSGTNLRPLNISTRGLVQPGDNVMIGGFILAGGYGSTHAVVRALGPSLASSGIANPLADPILELHDGNGATLATNDDWQETQEAELNATGLAPTNPAESAIFALLQPAPYTAIVRGKGTAIGLALVEVYQLP